MLLTYIYTFPNRLRGQEVQSNAGVAHLLAHKDRRLMHTAHRQHQARQYAETRHWHTTDKISETKWQASQRLWLARGRPTWEVMGVAGCGYLASESMPQHWLKKKTKTLTTVKLLILSIFRSLFHSLYLSFIYTHDNCLWCCWQELIPKSSLSFVLCKRNRNIVQSIIQKIKSYTRSEFSDCCSRNIERHFFHIAGVVLFFFVCVLTEAFGKHPQ